MAPCDSPLRCPSSWSPVNCIQWPGLVDVGQLVPPTLPYSLAAHLAPRIPAVRFSAAATRLVLAELWLCCPHSTIALHLVPGPSIILSVAQLGNEALTKARWRACRSVPSVLSLKVLSILGDCPPSCPLGCTPASHGLADTNKWSVTTSHRSMPSSPFNGNRSCSYVDMAHCSAVPLVVSQSLQHLFCCGVNRLSRPKLCVAVDSERLA